MSIYIGGAGEKDYSAMRGPAPQGFHVMTADDYGTVITIIRNLVTLGGGAATTYNYIYHMHLPLAGFVSYIDGQTVGALNTDGFYRTPCVDSSTGKPLGLHINNSAFSIDPYGSGFGFFVRCAKDTYVEPDGPNRSAVGTVYPQAGGVWENTTDGLISFKFLQLTITIQDKNIGATTRWNYGDALDIYNVGTYHQRGNNTGFTTLPTIVQGQIDTTGYGPGNPFSQNYFFVPNESYLAPMNNNLRGCETGIVINPAEVQNVYIGENPTT